MIKFSLFISDSSIGIKCSKSAFINENVTCYLAVNSERQTVQFGFNNGLKPEVLYTSIILYKYKYLLK